MELLGLAILLVMLLAPVILYFERKHRHAPNRFERAIAKAERALAPLDGAQLRERLRAHPYWRWIRGSAIADELLAKIDRGEARAIVDAWDRVTSELVAAERAAGHQGTPRLVADETQLAALVRAIAKRDAAPATR